MHLVDSEEPLDLDGYRARGLRANAAAASGHLNLAERIANRAKLALPDETAVHPFAASRSLVIMHRTGDVARARAMLLDALNENASADDPEVFNTILAALLQAAQIRSDSSWWNEALAIAAANQAIVDPLITLALRTYEHRVQNDDHALRRERHLADVVLASVEPWKLSVLMIVATHTVNSSEKTQLLERIVPAVANFPALNVLTLFHFAAQTRRSGALIDARQLVERALESSLEHELSYWAARLNGQLAIISALMGDVDQSHASAQHAMSWALPRGTQTVVNDATHAESLIELADGQFEAAHSILVNLPIDPDRWMTSSYGMAEALDLAEACQRLGRQGDAAPAISAFHAVAGAAVPPETGSLVEAIGAMLDTDQPRSLLRFKQALTMGSTANFPLETARVRIAYGYALQQAGADSVETRAQFRLAANTFRALGASAWAERAEREALEQAKRPDVRSVDIHGDAVNLLSRKERQVASLAARGLSNKEIGVRLFISDRTVAFHLYNLFPKLGVTSRAGLRDALNGDHEESAD